MGNNAEWHSPSDYSRYMQALRIIGDVKEIKLYGTVTRMVR